MNPVLKWVDGHPTVYFWLAGGLLIMALAGTLIPWLRDRGEDPKGPDWTWGLVVLALLVAGRWPSLFAAQEFNSDESQLLAGAHALTADPVFWRSVDGGTAGPLDFLALWPAGWLLGWTGYIPARLTALALLALTLILTHQCLARVLGRRLARLTGLAAVCFEALTLAPDFLHYSTELLPITLLAVAAYAATRRGLASGNPWWNGLGGLMLGAVPLAKLQVVPLAAGMGLYWLWAEGRAQGPQTRRHRTLLVGGALLPAAVCAGQLTCTGEWVSFINSYWRFNLNYAATGSIAPGALLLETLNNSLWWDSLLHLWLPGSFVWLGLMFRLRPVADRALRTFTWLATAAGLISLGSILGPGRPFLHYWQLSVVPTSLLLGVLAARLAATSGPTWRKASLWLVALGAAGVTGLMVQHRARNPNHFVGRLAGFQQHSRSLLAAHVAAQARPGESIAIWGWSNYVYVETGLRQATRDAHVGSLLEAGPLQAYFRARYLADLRQARPQLFLDTIGPASLHYAAPDQAHDRNFPELAALIRENYVLVEAVAGARIYRRSDLPPR
jgi:hypothetical protein